ncbi:MAG TPA: class I SAM-dependent methyltransferase [Vicinamibacterales bacterium]|nr:class I SAM-dependent methyltransferase [Vicinamibacterales bacterium]
MRRAAADVLERVGLFRPTFELRGLLRSVHPDVLYRNAPFWWRGAPDGAPLPSRKARMLVSGSADIEWFLDGGRLAADTIRRAVERQGVDLSRLGRVLDFGCGCGRVLRHWHDLTDVELHGVDTQPLLVDEARRTVPRARIGVNQLEPPLPYQSGTFDLVYSLSVFTHLDEPVQFRWRDEIRRVLKPGGLWLVTTQGTAYLPKLNRAERARFEAGGVVCQRQAFRGLNLCQTFHPESYVRGTLARGLTVVDFEPEGAKGNPRQDLYVLRRTQADA